MNIIKSNCEHYFSVWVNIGDGWYVVILRCEWGSEDLTYGHLERVKRCWGGGRREKERGRERTCVSCQFFWISGFWEKNVQLQCSLWNYVCFLFLHHQCYWEISVELLLISYVEMEGEKYFFEGEEQKKFLLHSFIHNSFILATHGVPGTLLILYKIIF